ncbi:Uncharacterised protein [uncultured archaeon]|nr:Uncharacterised protein [uncultured archaeon]
MGLQKKKFLLREAQKEAKKAKSSLEVKIPETYNQRRKEQYKLMASHQELGIGELKDYLEARAFILSHSQDQDNLDLPDENPTRIHYNLAKTLYEQLRGDFALDTSFFS